MNKGTFYYPPSITWWKPWTWGREMVTVEVDMQADAFPGVDELELRIKGLLDKSINLSHRYNEEKLEIAKDIADCQMRITKFRCEKNTNDCDNEFFFDGGFFNKWR